MRPSLREGSLVYHSWGLMSDMPEFYEAPGIVVNFGVVASHARATVMWSDGTIENFDDEEIEILGVYLDEDR